MSETTTKAKLPLISIVLLTDQYGYRMKKYGPSGLLHIQGKPLLQHQIEAIKAVYNNYEIVVCTGYETYNIASFIKNKYPNENLRIVENQLYEQTNSSESLRLCLNNIYNDRILICGCGILLTANHLRAVPVDKTCVPAQALHTGGELELDITTHGDNRLQNFGINLNSELKWSELLFLRGKKEIELFKSTLSTQSHQYSMYWEAVNDTAKDIVYNVVNNFKTSLRRIDNTKTIKGEK